jgi:hypothetical protein
MTAKPEDATWAGPWDGARRLFDGQSWAVDHRTHNGRSYRITVAVIGTQYDDGRIQRRIVVGRYRRADHEGRGPSVNSGVDGGRCAARQRCCVSWQGRGMSGACGNVRPELRPRSYSPL